jgi:hypothetical protein
MNKLVRDAGGTASSVIDAMIQGLQNVPENFEIDMSSYGDSSNGVCYGCAATCTIMQISGNVFTPYEINGIYLRSLATGYSELDVLDFESIIDDLRQGDLLPIKEELDVTLPEPKIELPVLGTSTWKEGLWVYEAYRDQLREVGL